MNKETQNKRINEAQIYVKNRFRTMSDEEYENLCHGDGLLKVVDEAMKQFNVDFEDVENVFNRYSKPSFKFENFCLSIAQTSETASLLDYTIQELNDENRDRVCGKLKFFMDLYVMTTDSLDDQTITNYYEFLMKLIPKDVEDALTTNEHAADDYFCDVVNDYIYDITKTIHDLFEVFKNEGWIDIDDIIDYIQTIDINYQEQHFILDCYYSECSNYKIMRRIDDELYDETDYFCCLKQAAITQYCKEFNCQESELLIQEIL